MSKKEKIKKVLKKIISFIFKVIFFSPLAFSALSIISSLDLYGYKIFLFGIQLSEETVLSISDNLSKITDEYTLPFYGNNFKIEQYKREGQLSGKYVATVSKDPHDDNPVNFNAVFYYDTISNCDKYYEVSYNPVTEKALCIYSDYSFKIRNPFSAKVIKKDNDW